MKKQTKLGIISFFSLLFMLSFSVSVFAETETVTKIETYKSNDKDEKRECEKQFSKDGIKYKFLDETYEIVNQEDNFNNEIKTLTINKETKSKTYSPKKMIKKNGITYKIKNVENSVRTVKKKNGRKVTGYLSFDSKNEALSAPTTRVFSANGATAKCKKKNMVKEKAASWQSSWIDFTFRSSDKDYYEWNGHEIDGKSKNPLKGYDDEILKSINVDKSNYKIGDTYWKGSAHKKNGIYTRKLRVEVKKKGYFCEDVAAKFDQAVEYIDTDIHIVNQIPEVMNYKENCEYLVVDVEQYADDADVIIDSLMKVKEAVNTKIIIYAVAFSPKSELLSGLYSRGIRNYIFSEMLSDKKKDLTNCINGFYEQWGYESLGIYFEGEDEDNAEEITKKEKVKTIGVAGAVRRMGTTTQALQIVKYLKFNGYKAAYFEMNNHGFVKAVREFYEDSQYDEMEGLTEYQNVDMYYKAERLKEVQDKDYEYIVYDYGVYSEHDFNKVSFLEKDIQIFVVGSKPDEFEKTYELIKSNFYNDVFYVFNFTAETEKKDIKELMEDKADKTFFADESKDPFTFGNSEIYKKMIPIENKSEEKKEKKSGFFRKRKK